MNAYQARDTILRSMGFKTYWEYLRSNKWAGIRLRVLRKDRFVCRSCGARATQVHHSKYDRKVLSGRSLKGLWSCCDSCHRAGEFDASRKTTINECNDRMRVELSKGQKKWRKKLGLPENWIIHPLSPESPNGDTEDKPIKTAHRCGESNRSR